MKYPLRNLPSMNLSVLLSSSVATDYFAPALCLQPALTVAAAVSDPHISGLSDRDSACWAAESSADAIAAAKLAQSRPAHRRMQKHESGKDA